VVPRFLPVVSCRAKRNSEQVWTAFATIEEKSRWRGSFSASVAIVASIMQVPLDLPPEESTPEFLNLLIHHPQQASLSLELAFLESPNKNRPLLRHHSPSQSFRTKYIHHNSASGQVLAILLFPVSRFFLSTTAVFVLAAEGLARPRLPCPG
jgi:hypothetical protein